MNALLIYNDNISPDFVASFKRELGAAFQFKILSQSLANEAFSFDREVTDFLLTTVKQKQYDVIFLPFNLSFENYLEFIGIQIAYHIRLTPEFGNQTTPIVFFGEEDAYQINKLTEQGKILFTSNIYLTKKQSIDSFTAQIKFAKENNSFDFERSFLHKINVKSPGNYLTHHSIANEWAILRWAKVLGLDSNEIKKIEGTIGTSLYYKYLKALLPISESANVAKAKLQKSGKILFIDDELDKGWQAIFEKITEGLPEQSVEFCGSDFKFNEQIEILNSVQEKVMSFDPDVVVLDLRLHDDDFNEGVPINEISGYKILKNIKRINKGIQVIIFSATNKVWNLQALQGAGADGFFIKESPENTIKLENQLEFIENMYTALDKALEMSFLKKVELYCNGIRTLPDIGESEDDLDFKSRLNNNLDIAFKLLQSSNVSKKYINYAYLQLFQIIEDFASLPSVFNIVEDECFVYCAGEEVLVRKKLANKRYEIAITYKDRNYTLKSNEDELKGNRPDVFFKVSAILFFRFGLLELKSWKWTTINEIRNTKVAHFNTDNMVVEQDVFMILEFIKKFISRDLQNVKNISKGLKMMTEEESMKLFKQKFNIK